MDVGSILSASQSNVEIVSRDEIGFSGLTADDFMQMLVTELQNQDPLSPMDNGELLNQLTTMQGMQSNVELSDSIDALTQQEGLASGASLIGKRVVGFEGETEIDGVVTSALIQDDEVYLSVNDSFLRLSQVVGVREP